MLIRHSFPLLWCVVNWVALATPGTAEEPKAPPGATIVFRDVPNPPGGPARYTLEFAITFDGHERTHKTDCTTDAGSEGKVLAAFFETDLTNREPVVTCSADGTKLVIQGVKDPRTGKLYPVKDIKFTSPDLPKEFWPTITVPKNKG